VAVVFVLGYSKVPYISSHYDDIDDSGDDDGGDKMMPRCVYVGFCRRQFPQ